MIFSVEMAEGMQVAVLDDLIHINDRLIDRQDPNTRTPWRPVGVTLEVRRHGRMLMAPDAFFGGGTPRLVLPSTTVERLGDVLERNGELLPLLFSGADPFFLHNTQLIDCLDLERSAYSTNGPGGRIGAFSKPVLLLDRVGDAEMFCLPQEPLRTLVTARFRDRFLALGLKGLDFVPYFAPGSA